MKSQNKSLIHILLACGILLSSFSYAQASDKVAAIVNGKKISVEDVEDMYKTLPSSMKKESFAKMYPDILNSMTVDEALLQKAKKSGISKTELYKERKDIMEDKFLIQSYMNDYVDKHLKESEIKKFYRDIVKNIPRTQEYHVLHVDFSSKAKADKALAEIKAGTSFEAIMKRDHGNDLGYITEDHLTENLAKIIVHLKKGQVTKTAFKGKGKYHILKLVDKRIRPKPTLQELEPRIKSILGQKMINDYITHVVSSSKIERFDLHGKPLKSK